MTLSILQNVTAVGIGHTTYFGATGGTPPYLFSIVGPGAGGSINLYTGFYQAPYDLVSTPTTSIDTIQVTDSLNATATTTITVGGVLELVCDVIKNYLNLASDHVYVWDQKINQPIDSSLYVAVSIASCKPFGNNIEYKVQPTGPFTNLFAYRNYQFPANPNMTPFNTYSSYQTNWYWLSYQQTVQGALTSVQSVNMQAILDIDIISRGPDARDKKELIPLALNSVYSVQQQEANSFYIGLLPSGSRFINLSQIDGAAIPYRFKISYAIQYFITNNNLVPYYTSFATPQVTINS